MPPGVIKGTLRMPHIEHDLPSDSMVKSVSLRPNNAWVIRKVSGDSRIDYLAMVVIVFVRLETGAEARDSNITKLSLLNLVYTV